MLNIKRITRFSTSALLASSIVLSSVSTTYAQTLSDPGNLGGLIYDNALGDGGISGLVMNPPRTADEVFNVGKDFVNDVSSIMGHVLELAPNLTSGQKNMMSAFRDTDKYIVGGIDTMLKAAEFSGATNQERKQMLWDGVQSQYSDSIISAVGAATAANFAATGASATLATVAGITAGIGIGAAAALYFGVLNDKIDWLQRPATTHDLGLKRIGNQMCHVTATTRLPREFTCALRINRPDDPKSVAFSICNDFHRTCFDIPDPQRTWTPDLGSRAAAAMKNGGLSPIGSRIPTEGWNNDLTSDETGRRVVEMADAALNRANEAVDFTKVSSATATFIDGGYDAQAYALQELVAALVLLYMMENIYAEIEHDPAFEADLYTLIKDPETAPAIAFMKEADALHHEKRGQIVKEFDLETRVMVKDLGEQHSAALAKIDQQIGEDFDKQKDLVASECKVAEDRLKERQELDLKESDQSKVGEIKRSYRVQVSDLKRECRINTTDINREKRKEVSAQRALVKSEQRGEVKALTQKRKEELTKVLEVYDEESPSRAIEIAAP